jgi:hypothetical protein
MQFSFVATKHHDQMYSAPIVCSGGSSLKPWPKESLAQGFPWLSSFCADKYCDNILN